MHVWYWSHNPAHTTSALMQYTLRVQTGLSLGQAWLSTRPHGSFIAAHPLFPASCRRGQFRAESRMEKKFRQTAIEPLFGAWRSARRSRWSRSSLRIKAEALLDRAQGVCGASAALVLSNRYKLLKIFREEPLPSLFHQSHFDCAAGASWVEELKAAGAHSRHGPAQVAC